MRNKPRTLYNRKYRNLWRKPIHWLCRRYIQSCGGAFRNNDRYFVSMTDQQYHYYTTLVRDVSPEEFHRIIWALREHEVEV